MRRLFAAIGTCGLAISVAVGNPPAPVPPAPGSSVSAGVPAARSRVAQLIANLGAEDFRDRESAVAELEKSGAGAIPFLREATRSDDPEVRRRAAGILFRLERTADSTTLLAPKKLALEYRDTPLGSAINDLKARTKLNLVLDTGRIADPLRKVTCVTAGEVPVWEALEQFCAAAGLREVHRLELDVPKQQPQGRRAYVPPPQIPNPDAVPIVLVDGKGARLAGARDSAVRILVMPRTFPGHRVTLGTGETTLCFDVAPTPGLNWQDVVAVKINKLVDDAGRVGGAGTAKPVSQGNPEFEGVVGWGGGPGIGFIGGGFGGRFDPRTGMPIPPETLPNPRMVNVPLKLGTPTARSLKRLEGHVLGEIQVPNQNLITILNPAKNTSVGFDGPGQTRLTVVAVGEPKGNAGVTVQVQLQYPSPWAVNARRGFNPGGIWPESPRATQTPIVQAFDANGKQMVSQHNNGNYNDSSDDGMTMFQHITMTFRKDAGGPAKLVLVGPRPVIVEVPFAMENVPLP